MDFVVEIAEFILELLCEGAAEYADSPKRSRFVRGLIYGVLMALPTGLCGYGGYCLYREGENIGAGILWGITGLFFVGWIYLTFRRRRKFK